jgi:hypothetical protein
MKNPKNSPELLKKSMNNFAIFCEFLGFVRLIALCLAMWFFLWAHVYRWPFPPEQFQNQIAYPIFLLIALYAHFKLWKLRHGYGRSIQAQPTLKRRRGRPPKRKVVVGEGKRPECFGELKMGLPLKQECQTCTWIGECQ